MTSDELEAEFRILQSASRRSANVPLEERNRRLVYLERSLLRHADRIAATISADFGHRSISETRLLELVPCLQSIRHARKHLRQWIAPEHRAASRWFLAASASVLHQPLGVVKRHPVEKCTLASRVAVIEAAFERALASSLWLGADARAAKMRVRAWLIIGGLHGANIPVGGWVGLHFCEPKKQQRALAPLMRREGD